MVVFSISCASCNDHFVPGTNEKLKGSILGIHIPRGWIVITQTTPNSTCIEFLCPKCDKEYKTPFCDKLKEAQNSINYILHR